MSNHSVKIRMFTHGNGAVIVDDVELKCVKRVEFRAAAGGENEVCLVLSPGVVEIDGPAHVRFEHDDADAAPKA